MLCMSIDLITMRHMYMYMVHGSTCTVPPTNYFPHEFSRIFANEKKKKKKKKRKNLNNFFMF